MTGRSPGLAAPSPRNAPVGRRLVPSEPPPWPSLCLISELRDESSPASPTALHPSALTRVHPRPPAVLGAARTKRTSTSLLAAPPRSHRCGIRHGSRPGAARPAPPPLDAPRRSGMGVSLFYVGRISPSVLRTDLSASPAGQHHPYRLSVPRGEI